MTLVRGSAAAALCAALAAMSPASASPPAKACADAATQALATQVAGVFSTLRKAARGRVRTELAVQQARWAKAKDTACASGDRARATAVLAARRDELKALQALTDNDEPLDDPAPVRLLGAWRVGAVLDPERAGAGTPADLARTLLLADLPPRGATVTGRAGQICGAPEPACRTIGWTRGALGGQVGGERLAEALKLGAQTPVYTGALGARRYITLIQRPDGHLLANFPLCGPNATHCRNGFEDWAPVGPDSRVVVGPIR